MLHWSGSKSSHGGHGHSSSGHGLLLVLAAVLIAVVSYFFFTTNAHATVTVSAVATPSTTQAGGHPDLTATIDFTADPGSDSVKDIKLLLARGLVANPLGPATCSRADFDADTCPADSEVGTTTVSATATILAIPVDTDSPGTVYNIETQPDDTARLGIWVRPTVPSLPKMKLEQPAKLRPDNFMIESTINNVPNAVDSVVGEIPLVIKKIVMTLKGDLPNGKSFLRSPTSCSEAVSSVRITSYANPEYGPESNLSYTPTGCDNLPFNPSVEGSIGAPGKTAEGASPPVTNTIVSPNGDADIRDAVVTLPSVLGANPAVLGRVCSLASFNAGQCAESSIVGSATADSPLLPSALTGTVRIVEVPNDFLPKFVVALTGKLSLQVEGKIAILPNGQQQVTFAGLPDLPLSRFTLSLQDVALNNSDICKPDAPLGITSALTSHAGSTASPASRLAVQGCVATAAAAPKSPRVSWKVGKVKRGLFTLRVRVTGSDYANRVSGVKLQLPAGVTPNRKKIDLSADGDDVNARTAAKARGRAVTVKLKEAADKTVVTLSRVRVSGTVRKALSRRKKAKAVFRASATVGKQAFSHRKTLSLRGRVR